MHGNQTYAPYGRNGHHPAIYVPKCKCGWIGSQVVGRPAGDAAYRAHKDGQR